MNAVVPVFIMQSSVDKSVFELSYEPEIRCTTIAVMVVVFIRMWFYDF